jgi:phosphonate transport system permease protein
MTMTNLSPDLNIQITTHLTRKRLFAFSVPAIILVYLTYIFFSFDIMGLAGRARMDNAIILTSDFWSYKTHVTRENRSGDVSVSIEGDARGGTYPNDRLPDWVTITGDVTNVDLGRGYEVTYDNLGARMFVPDYGLIDIRPDGNRLILTAPQPLPDWINASEIKVTVTTPAGRFNYSRAKVETFKYQAGWEMFFFTIDSPFFNKGPLELLRLATMGDRINVDHSNIAAMVSDFLNNSAWRHGDVFWALFETMLMAFLGTIGAAVIALPLAFAAASNFMPLRAIRFAFRRVFDFIRGVDGLIWTIILSRAFGPGPMTGALAILITDTGSFGKMFSEALENIDEKQVEGVRSTGANAVIRARFGVIPQITPVLLSQVLYFLESNTRSATVIGAIVGGGIGLLLTQAIQTQRDWEEVAYYMVLIVLMVILMDAFSGWLRRKLIKGE